MLLHAGLAAGLGEVAFEVVHEVEPAVEASLADEAWPFEIGRHAIGIADDERRVRHAQEA